MIDGAWVLREGRILTFDERAVLGEAGAIAAEVVRPRALSSRSPTGPLRTFRPAASETRPVTRDPPRLVRAAAVVAV
jgi:hypothetical protein